MIFATSSSVSERWPVIKMVRARGFASRTVSKTTPPSPSGICKSISTTLNFDSLSCRRCLTTIMGQADAVVALAEEVPKVSAQVAVVVDNQDERLVEGFVHKLQETGELDGLRDDLPGPGGECLFGGGRAGVGRYQERDRGGALLLDLAVEGQAVHAGHLQVQERDVVRALSNQLECGRTVVCAIDPVAQVGKDVAQVLGRYRGHHRRRGSECSSLRLIAVSPSWGEAVSRIVNVLPRPGSLVTQRVP